MSTLESNGIMDYVHRARKVSWLASVLGEHVTWSWLTRSQVQLSDFDRFDYVFAMDRSNLSDLVRLQKGKPGSKAKVMLFGEFSGTRHKEVIADPYYGGQEGFDTAFEQALRFSRNFLKATFPDFKHPW